MQVQTQRFQGIIDVLSVFAKMGAYGVIDRIAGALTPEAVEHALYDAMRSLSALTRQVVIVKIENKGEVKLIDWTEELDNPKYQLAEIGKVIDVIMGSKELRGKEIRYIRLPPLPGQDELNEFFKCVREGGFEGLSLARKVALLALTPFKGR